MKCLITFILIFSALCCKATDTLTTQLINTVYTEIVDSTTKYYYLLNRAENPRVSQVELKFRLREMKEYDKSIPFEEFFSYMDRDTAVANWQGYNFNKAKIVERKDLPKYLEWSSHRIFRYYVYKNLKDTAFNKQYARGDEIMVWIEKGMSKKQTERQREKAIAKLESRPKEEKNYYIFSKPIYSNDRRYVLISLNKSYTGCTHVFKLVDGKWYKVLSLPCWIA